MADLSERPLEELLDRVAAPEPGPAAGACAAWTASLAAGLVELAAAVTLRHSERAAVHPRMQEVRARAEELRRRARELADRDVEAYAAVLEARGDGAALGAALSVAADVPLEIAEVAAEVALLSVETSRGGTPVTHGDARAGALLAAAAAGAGAELVAINLAETPHDRRVELARAAAARAAAGESDASGG